MQELTEEEIQSLYAWIDEIPLSRPKRNITRDFSDGVATAEIIRHFIPKLVDLHNYPPANAVAQKLYNWNTLSQKAFRKLSYLVSEDVINGIVQNKPGYIEYLLFQLRQKIEAYLSKRAKDPTKTSQTNLTSPYDQTNPPPLPHPNQQVSGQGSGGVDAFGGYGELGSHPGMASPPTHQSSTQELSPYEKDQMILELQDTIQILQLKVDKLEELLVLKDRRIDDL
ncbi:Sperm flagellar protein 1, partial [Rhizophlyctis rosea]